jgi:FAD:protein FMN transferase
VSADQEAIEEFACFGGTCAALVIGSGEAGSAADAAALARRALLAWHERFSRFLPESELSLLNSDPRARVPVSPMMARFAQAVLTAGSLTDGLVDATLLGDLERAGYAHDLPQPLMLSRALELAPARRPAAGAASQPWRQIEADVAGCTLTRPPGLELDSGGLAKGLFADALAETLASHPSFAVNCAGDLAVGGAVGMTREIRVQSPFDERVLYTFELCRTGVATSGIGRRSWLDRSGAPAHHLLDPATGRPAFTGVVQATALAPSALIAEIRAKAAILSGPDEAGRWLAHGGVVVFDDGSHEVIAPPPVVTLRAPAGRSAQRVERAAAVARPATVIAPAPAPAPAAAVAAPAWAGGIANALTSHGVRSSAACGREM